MAEYTDDNGKFAKGNPGKPKGAISEKTKIWNEIKDWFTGDGLKMYQQNLQDMLMSDKQNEKAEAMKRFEALMGYFSPKLASTESKVQNDNTITVTYENNPVRLTPETDRSKE